MARRIRMPEGSPLLVLAIVSLLSLGARALMLDQPCQSPCTRAAQHTLIFDEAYYVNAARVIAGIRPAPGDHYDKAPLGTDPNAEHPQGAKLIMAGAIELFGDGPFAWRIGSVIFGSIAILGMYALVRAGGGGEWPAVGAAALMACDNLLLVQGRIGTLDIYALAPMLWGVAAYLRGRPVLAGAILAIAYSFKEVAPYALVVLGLIELGRVLVARRDPDPPPEWALRPSVARLVAVCFVSLGLWVGLLGLMGLIATPYADADRQLITGGPFAHLWHMITYASHLTSPGGPTGIASYPWQWLVDLKPITYLRINPSLPGQGLYGIHPVSAFLGFITPPILLVGLPGVAFALYRVARPRRFVAELAEPAPVPFAMGASVIMGRGDRDRPRSARRRDRAGGPVAGGGVLDRPLADVQLALVAAAWFLGTWAPYELQSALDSRTSYLYYMVVVMPGVYLGAVYAVSLAWRRAGPWLRGLIGLWALSVLVGAVLLYPFVAAF